MRTGVARSNWLVRIVASGLWLGLSTLAWAESPAGAPAQAQGATAQVESAPASGAALGHDHDHGAMQQMHSAESMGATGGQMPGSASFPPGYPPVWGAPGGYAAPTHPGAWGNAVAPGHPAGWGNGAAPGYMGGWGNHAGGPGFPGGMNAPAWQNRPMAPPWANSAERPMGPGWRGGDAASAMGGPMPGSHNAVGTVAAGSFDHTQQQPDAAAAQQGMKKCTMCIDKKATAEQKPCARCAQCKQCRQGGAGNPATAEACRMCQLPPGAQADAGNMCRMCALSPNGGAGMGCGHCRSRMGMRVMDPLLLGQAPVVVEQALHYIKGLLAVTAEQEAAWKSYADAAMALVAVRMEKREGMMAPVTSALEVAERRTQMAARMVEKRQQSLQAFKGLLEQLNEEQKGRLHSFFMGGAPGTP
ncbi:Spy/CpxP family protein refolding chaperone [Candidatus Magnetaquicoccus inordinatus]|uniref:Spy/CpxP family protein refolding chaperone n=1 Tax=Candidatus Magnetaquicoccus inordinatus TaxID=2496818 RepID=UPI00187D2ED0|nr:Spy/CpxP family protein refolding chaperone [Candidatus Magnetaquicoccus inordinatus]